MAQAEGLAKMDAQGSDKDGGCGQDASAGTPKRRRTAKSEHLITLKAMVDGAKTTPRAVRLYEAEKLISAAQRSSGGHRLFDEGELDKLRLIIDLRACGFSIEEIRELLAARQTSPSKESAMALQALLSRHIEGLKRKLALITELGREFQCAVETLDRCATCDNPAGKSACLSCEVLTSRAAPRCMRFI
ncbi:MAG TPA: MerR family transcriptional regulator [Pseudomonadota bacterium]|nr:MerR family transcriptional regulator [Pseudomonadota bacterium]HND10245.1 MerR family transcriptional regulator [Pseudomonadota bacterium]HNI59539.1 MerR family transcriptional regulator [Pseudomonadota bacterium]HNK45579.1 MerR family transcriptional regulator [Pseudomonadota bacterium]HNN51504.1 MerR family transcriptional regulator [Pseudomonadota bacterium]